MARKFITQKKQTKEELFASLVTNAIDFLDSSLDNLELRPKNSIVDFYTSIELFLKARLMNEHWTLILSKPESADINTFQVGDFYSVTLEDSIKRLKSILGFTVETRAAEGFKALGEHRNQIVHFSHTDYSDLAAAKAGVVVEQWASWYHLHQLLTVSWKSIFSQYLTEINRINDRMMQQREFIVARYKELTPQIEIQKKAGKSVIDCEHCEMHSAIINDRNKWGDYYSCIVCGVNDLAVKAVKDTIDCSACGKGFLFFNKKTKVCPHCSTQIHTDFLIEICTKKYTEGDDWWEPGQPCIANCHTCKYHKPSVFYIEGLWSCVSCFDRGWGAISCEDCGELATGDLQSIEYLGCHKCADQPKARTS